LAKRIALTGLGKLVRRNPSLIYRWIREAGLNAKAPTINKDIAQIAFDEMLHCIQSKKENFSASSPLTVIAGKLSPGFSALVIAQPFQL